MKIVGYIKEYEPSEAAKIYMESGLPHKISMPNLDTEPLSDDMPF